MTECRSADRMIMPLQLSGIGIHRQGTLSRATRRSYHQPTPSTLTMYTHHARHTPPYPREKPTKDRALNRSPSATTLSPINLWTSCASRAPMALMSPSVAAACGKAGPGTTSFSVAGSLARLGTTDTQPCKWAYRAGDPPDYLLPPTSCSTGASTSRRIAFAAGRTGSPAHLHMITIPITTTTPKQSDGHRTSRNTHLSLTAYNTRTRPDAGTYV